MFRVRKPAGQQAKKLRVPPIIWVLLVLASIFGVFLTKQCHKNLDKVLEVKNIEIETQTAALAQIYFEIENKANFFIQRKVIVRAFSGNLELGSKMIIARLEKNKTTGFVVTIDFIKLLKKDETIDEISVRFYD